MNPAPKVLRSTLQATVVLRERPPIEVLDLALRFLVRHRVRYGQLALLLLLPSAVASVWLGEAASYLHAYWLATGLFLFPLELPFLLLTSRLMFEERVGLGALLLATLRSLPRYLFARVVQVLAVGVGLFMLLVPGLWLGAVVLFLPEVSVLEGRNVFQFSLGRAQRLASADSFGVFLLLLLLLTIIALSAVLCVWTGTFLLGEVLQISMGRYAQSKTHVLAIVGALLAVPFVAAARFLAYLHVRTQTEGWDVQTLFHSLAARSAEGS